MVDMLVGESLVGDGDQGRPLRRPGTRAADLEREYSTRKPCAPFCTVSCVHRVAMIDLVREKPREALARFFPSGEAGTPAKRPLGIRFLSSIFLPPENGKHQNPAAKAMARQLVASAGLQENARFDSVREASPSTVAAETAARELGDLFEYRDRAFVDQVH